MIKFFIQYPPSSIWEPEDESRIREVIQNNFDDIDLVLSKIYIGEVTAISPFGVVKIGEAHLGEIKNQYKILTHFGSINSNRANLFKKALNGGLNYIVPVLRSEIIYKEFKKYIEGFGNE